MTENKGLKELLRRHLIALILFPALSMVWVGDTLIRGYDLSAFDIVFRLPHWQAEHEYRGVQQIILSDSPQAHYPERALKWGAARNGQLIDFNPYIFSGIPDQAQGVGGFVTSPFQLFMDVSEAIDWSTWLRLAAAGLIMYAFLVVLGLSRWAAMLGGVLWAFNFHQIAWLEFPQHLATQLWIPALFCFNYALLRWGISWERLLGLFITNALFFTSGYSIAVLNTYVAIGLFNTIYLVADGSMTPAERSRRWVWVHAAFVLAAAVLLPKIIVDIQAIEDGLRGNQHWRQQTKQIEWGLQPILATLKNILPDIADYKRFFSANQFGGIWGKPYTGRPFFGNIVGAKTYASVLIFLFIPITLLWLKDAVRRPLVIASIAVLLFSFGMIHKDPLLFNAFRLVPGTGYGGHERFLTHITFFISILAAVGCHILMNLAKPLSYKAFWIVFILVIASPLLILVADPSMNLRPMQYPIAVLLATGVVAAALCYFRLWRYLPVLAVTVAALDLLIVTHGFNPRMEDQRNFPTTPTIDMLLADQSAYRTAEVSTHQLYPPNVLQFYAIPSIGGYWTVAPHRYLRFVKHTIDDYHVTGNGQLFFFTVNHEVFRLLNVKYLLSEHTLDDERLKIVRQAPGYQVYELTDALPRVYCASNIVRFRSDKKLLKQFDETARTYDRPMAIVSENEQTAPLTTDCEVRDIQTYLNGAEFTVRAGEDTYVLAPYNYSENWRAFSDDGELKVRQANYNFIAVPVEAGARSIRLVYQEPLILVFSWILIGLGLVACGWFVVSGRRTPGAWFVAVSGAVLVLHSAMELPWVANNDLPERLERPAVMAHH